MSFLKTYSARGVNINYAGVSLNEGRPEDAFITIAENAPRVAMRKGLSGDTSSALSPDHSVLVTLSFFPESLSASVLSVIYNGLKAAEMAGTPVLGAVPLYINDPSGSTLLVAAEAVLTNKEETSLGADSGSVSFEFYVETGYQFTGAQKVQSAATKALENLGIKPNLSNLLP